MRNRAAAYASVDGRGGGGGQFAGEGPDGVGGYVAGLARGFGGEVPHGVREFLDALEVRRELARVDELLLEEDVGHRREQQGVGAGPDGHVTVGEFGRAGPARVDDRERAAAGPQRLELAGEVGCGAQTPVGFQGLAPISRRWSVWSRSGTGMALASP